ncbi:alkaline phosphatase D family protein [Iningainema tapete]|uniref:Alkaline phosphatase n=1 Tax=Iningainema tapete BLCC-T55 TaxID=2748662 RepID=A0A8J7CAM8_9CYAN|nr:alkaline phosphatase [Iningainema tapete]MBD2777301.1 alkaline phosphatase [Iningainema tapete BLCC-T55]
MNTHFDRLLLKKCNRRNILLGAGFFTGLAVASQWRSVLAQPKFSAYPFSLGVTSGDPLPDSVILWTRLAPDPLNGGGMPSENVPVQWQVALDEKMSKVVLRGEVMATPELGHSVHVNVGGLQPERWYWYQFKVGNETSPIGRTRTAPASGKLAKQFRFAFASCQNYEQGYFAAYKRMAEEDLDLVVHLGDYIYEGAAQANQIRQHNGPEPVTLEEYRNRYALYKSDSDLQAVHAAFPWIVTWDDHEVDNNWAADIPQDPQLQSREQFLARRAAAFQAYYENMPLRESSIPRGSSLQLYRRLRFGNLVEFNVLDTRQYRTDQPCDDGIKPRCPEALDPSATLTGSEQENWLFRGLDRSRAVWNVIAQQVVFAQHDWTAGEDSAFNVDAWDGYVANRSRILNFLARRKPSNPVVLTGDTHSNWVNDLKADFNQPNSATVGTEFVGTSITSNFTASDRIEAALPESPWVKYFNGRQRGYVVCDLNPQRWRTDYRLLAPSPPTGATVSDPNAPITTTVSFELPNRGVVQRVS